MTGRKKKIDILKLLNEYIELGAVCCERDYGQFEESRLFSPEAEHLLDINECGRVLLTEASFALSVWPIVLYKSIRQETRMFFTPCCTDRFAPPVCVRALWKIENERIILFLLVSLRAPLLATASSL
jgi:hypothetical protein